MLTDMQAREASHQQTTPVNSSFPLGGVKKEEIPVPSQVRLYYNLHPLC